MQPKSRNVRIVTLLLLSVTSACIIAGTAAVPKPQRTAASTSNQDKMKACNDLADRKNLKGDDRKNFLHDCISKTTDAQPLSDMSQKDKLDACKKLADRKNLKGEDRRSFLKDCMNKANPK